MRWARSQIQRIPDAIEAVMRTFILGGALGLSYNSLAQSSQPWGMIQKVLEQPENEQMTNLLGLAGWFQPQPLLHSALKRMLAQTLQNPQRADDVMMHILLPTRAKNEGDPLLSNPFYGVGHGKEREILSGQVGPKDLIPYLNKVALNKARDVLRTLRKDESRRVGPTKDDEGHTSDPLDRIPTPHHPERIEKAALLNMLDPDHPTGKLIYNAIMAAANHFYGGKKRQSPGDVEPPGIQYFKLAFESIKHGKIPSRTEVAKKIRTPSTDVEKRRVRNVEEGMHERSLTQRHIQPILHIFAEHWDSGHEKQLLQLLLHEGYPREQAENAVRHMEEIVFKMLGV